MANIKSAKKRVITNEISRRRNIAYRSAVRSASRKVMDAVAASNLDQAKELFVAAQSTIAKAAQKGIYKKNTASRKVSRLAAYIRKASVAASA